MTNFIISSDKGCTSLSFTFICVGETDCCAEKLPKPFCKFPWFSDGRRLILFKFRRWNFIERIRNRSVNMKITGDGDGRGGSGSMALRQIE